ncbi:hypothetical protein [Flavobacterium hibernum]|uniref:DUF3278 domain-containing protein n=1 Tax=Flavobacterium hibernum TaxID=37752 RepID=A0A0D0EY64_9FLAO|nr:hypothetical protein [Flavobacterium hibernum]KIO50562.1 hypothetical protein IW18_21645 [Flavobacterium hibernum]OXA87427.1 hypothetical protein B0A73_10905 [Flavobacterium hibernum]STO14294.1 Uncharacterised protein [Flavobacterium hibernum]
MDFNDIQNAWNKEETNNVVLPSNLEKIKEANTPLDKIRKNLKKEFIYQVFSIIFMGFIPLFYDFPPKMTTLYYLLFSLFVAVCIYYLAKFYFFYKRLSSITLKTKDSLYETYFDIRLNMELYKTFGFALTPFLILYLIGFLYLKFSNAPSFLSNDFTNYQLGALFSIVVFTMLFMGIALEWWVHKFYGKFAKEIKKVIDELKEE